MLRMSSFGALAKADPKLGSMTNFSADVIISLSGDELRAGCTGFTGLNNAGDDESEEEEALTAAELSQREAERAARIALLAQPKKVRDEEPTSYLGHTSWVAGAAPRRGSVVGMDGMFSETVPLARSPSPAAVAGRRRSSVAGSIAAAALAAEAATTGSPSTTDGRRRSSVAGATAAAVLATEAMACSSSARAPSPATSRARAPSPAASRARASSPAASRARAPSPAARPAMAAATLALGGGSPRRLSSAACGIDDSPPTSPVASQSLETRVAAGSASGRRTSAGEAPPVAGATLQRRSSAGEAPPAGATQQRRSSFVSVISGPAIEEPRPNIRLDANKGDASSPRGLLSIAGTSVVGGRV